MTSTTTPAQEIANGLDASDLRARHESVPVDQLAMAAAHVRSQWGEYGYSIAVELRGIGGTLFRGHHSDGSDFYFVIDRYCNVADLPRS